MLDIEQSKAKAVSGLEQLHWHCREVELSIYFPHPFLHVQPSRLLNAKPPVRLTHVSVLFLMGDLTPQHTTFDNGELQLTSAPLEAL